MPFLLPENDNFPEVALLLQQTLAKVNGNMSLHASFGFLLRFVVQQKEAR